MSKSSIRKDKTCLNCRHVVSEIYCSNCGQKNEDTRKTFHHLFVHFFEDLTHYENAFWRTIKNLLFKPAALTIEYLSGKRLSYLAPVRLYIFISFVTFLTISLIPDSDINDFRNEKKKSKDKSEKTKSGKKFGLVTVDMSGMGKDSSQIERELISPAVQEIEKLINEKQISKSKGDTLINYIKKSEGRFIDGFQFNNLRFKSIKELDSLQKSLPANKKLTRIQYFFAKKTFQVSKDNTDEQLFEKFKTSFSKNAPKMLFIYMPIFAFFLWLFHSKKRWYYFDHGIFTLHYFSFLLLTFLAFTCVEYFSDLLFNDYIVETISGLLGFVTFIWSIIYFFKAHYRFYLETKTMSFIKSTFIGLITFFTFSFLLIGFILYTFINIK